jgi:hypothetical protein
MAAAFTVTVLVGAFAASSATANSATEHTVSANSDNHCTMTATTTDAAGRMTICVRYAYGHNDIVRVQGIEASYQSQHGYTLPYFSFEFRPAERNIADVRFASQMKQSYNVRKYSSGVLAPKKMTSMHFQPNERLFIVLRAFNSRSGTEDLNVSAIHIDLTRPGV